MNALSRVHPSLLLRHLEGITGSFTSGRPTGIAPDAGVWFPSKQNEHTRWKSLQRQISTRVPPKPQQCAGHSRKFHRPLPNQRSYLPASSPRSSVSASFVGMCHGGGSRQCCWDDATCGCGGIATSGRLPHLVAAGRSQPGSPRGITRNLPASTIFPTAPAPLVSWVTLADYQCSSNFGTIAFVRMAGGR